MRVFKGLSRAQNRIFFIMQGGMFLEYFDLFLYIHLAPIVVDEYFSPTSTDTLMVYMLTIFSVLFIRLLGVIIGGYFGDVYGRKPTMIVSILITGFCCVGFAILPAYETIGIIALLGLMFLRSLQSAASVNEISCAITYMTEIISRPYAFFVTAFMATSAFSGMFVALLAASIVMKIFPDGWKMLFLASGMLSFISFYYRKDLPESRIMINDIKSYTSRIHRRQAYWKEVKKTLFSKLPFIQLVLDMCGVLFFYLVYIYCSVILKNDYGFTPSEIINNNTIVSLVDWLSGFLLILLVPKYHPIKILKVKLALTFIIIFTIPVMLGYANSPSHILLIQCISILFLLGATPAQSLIVLLYPILCRVSMRNFIYTLNRLIVGVIGFLILFLGELKYTVGAII